MKANNIFLVSHSSVAFAILFDFNHTKIIALPCVNLSTGKEASLKGHSVIFWTSAIAFRFKIISIEKNWPLFWWTNAVTSRSNAFKSIFSIFQCRTLLFHTDIWTKRLELEFGGGGGGGLPKLIDFVQRRTLAHVGINFVFGFFSVLWPSQPSSGFDSGLKFFTSLWRYLRL